MITLTQEPLYIGLTISAQKLPKEHIAITRHNLSCQFHAMLVGVKHYSSFQQEYANQVSIVNKTSLSFAQYDYFIIQAGPLQLNPGYY